MIYKMKRQWKMVVSLLLTFCLLTGCSGAAEPGADTEDSAVKKSVSAEEEFAGDGQWTILVYLCGTDLESGQGSGTSDLQEMLQDTGKNARYVVQTGGCNQWQNEAVSSKKSERYEISGGEMTQLSSSADKNMGESSTLKDFVKWGMKNYGSNKLGLVLWDHGGGSITGVCMDEKHKSDILTLEEIDSALSGIERKFNFIGFDACLMSTLETATMLSKYASYMIASEETESGYGWDYKTISKAWKKNPKISTPDLGKVICDGFMASCKESGEQDTTTLAVTDLGMVSAINDELEKVAQNMNKTVDDVDTLGKISKGFRKAENYGGNNSSEGYTNMVDLGDIAAKIGKNIDTKALTEALNAAVVYQVKGKNRSHANGLSIYYPLSKSQSKKELPVFKKVSASKSYYNFVNMMLYGAENGTTEGYSENTDTQVSEDEGGELASDEKNTIELSEKMTLNDDGYYTFTIAKDSLKKVASVQYNLYMNYGEDYPMVYLGSDNFVDYNEETGKVTDMFDGLWPGLTDGNLLTLSIVEETDEYTYFSSPIKRNGKATNLRFVCYNPEKEGEDGEWEILGTWDGMDENGQAARDITPLEVGDKITPIYYLVDQETGDVEEIDGDTSKVTEDLNVADIRLEEGDYYYNFAIDDIFGNTKYLDVVEFEVDKKGEVSLK